MATILSSKMSTYGSPYAFYTVDLSYSSRTETTVVVSYTITSRLQYEESWMGYGLTGYLTVGGCSSGAIKIKGNESWSGNGNHTVSGSFTVTGLSATTSSLSTGFSVVSASSDGACGLNAVSGSALGISIYGIKTTPKLSASSVDLGSSITINLSSRLLSSYTHTLTYSFGSASGTIATKTSGSSVSFTPPISLAAQIPSAMSGTMTITCTTYTSSGTSLGSAAVSLTVKVPSSAKTSLSLSTSSVAFGNSVTVYLSSRLSSKYTHTLSYTFGDITEILCNKTSAASVNFEPSIELAKQIPNDMEGKMIISCDTYNGAGTFIGSSVTELTLVVSDKLRTVPMLGAESIYLGESLIVDLTNKVVPEYTHQISYMLDEEQYMIEHNPNNLSVEFQMPVDLANKMTEEDRREIEVLCSTYNGSGNLVGVHSSRVEVKVPEEIIPIINDINISEAVLKVEQDFEAYVSGLTKIAVLIDANGAYGSSIKSYSTMVEGITYLGREFTSDVIKGSGSVEVRTVVVDSRGRSNSIIKMIDVTSYYEPKIDMNLSMNDGSIEIQLSGSVASVDGKNEKYLTVSYRVVGEDEYYSEAVDLLDEEWNFNKVHIPENYDSEATWEFIAQLSDKNTSKSISMLTGKTVLSRKAGGTGIAFGKEATEDGFDCNWDAIFRGNTVFCGDVSFGKNVILDVLYPIGAFFWSSNPTNPSEFFGGTWEQIKDRFILAAGDTYEAGTKGGNSKVSLSLENMPSHNHTVSASANSHGGHTHSVSGSTNTTGSHTHTSQGYWAAGNGTAHAISRKTVSGDPTDTNSLNYAGSHYHTVSGTAASGGSHSHTITATCGNSGSGTAHENMPPYEVAYCWKRIA